MGTGALPLHPIKLASGISPLSSGDTQKPKTLDGGLMLLPREVSMVPPPYHRTCFWNSLLTATESRLIPKTVRVDETISVPYVVTI